MCVYKYIYMCVCVYIYIYIYTLKRQHEKYGLNLRKILLTPKFVTYWKKK